MTRLPAALGHAYARAFQQGFLSDDYLVLADGLEEVGHRPLARAIASVVRRGRRLRRSTFSYGGPAAERASAWMGRLGRLEHQARHALMDLFEIAAFRPSPRQGSLEPGAPVQVRHAWGSGRMPDWFSGYRLIRIDDRDGSVLVTKLPQHLEGRGDGVTVYPTSLVRPDPRAEAWAR